MAFKAGYQGYFDLDNAGGTPVDLSAYFDTVSVPQTADTLDVSVMGDVAKQYIAGMTDGDQISISGPYEKTIYTHLTGCKAAQAAGTASFSYSWGPGGSVSGEAKVSGECLVVGLELSNSVGGRSEFSATLQVTGAVTNGTW